MKETDEDRSALAVRFPSSSSDVRCGDLKQVSEIEAFLPTWGDISESRLFIDGRFNSERSFSILGQSRQGRLGFGLANCSWNHNKSQQPFDLIYASLRLRELPAQLKPRSSMYGGVCALIFKLEI